MLLIDCARVFLLTGILLTAWYLGTIKRDITNKRISLFIFFTLISELFTIFYSGYNLHIYTTICFCQIGIFCFLVSREINKYNLANISLIICFVFTAFIYLTNYSSQNFYPHGLEPDLEHLINVHQFFDFTTITFVFYILLCFQWLINLVKEDQKSHEYADKYIYIFSFILYGGGSFFMVAFGRWLIDDVFKWLQLWEAIFIPLWFVFYLLLFIGLIWKPIRSLSL